MLELSWKLSRTDGWAISSNEAVIECSAGALRRPL